MKAYDGDPENIGYHLTLLEFLIQAPGKAGAVQHGVKQQPGQREVQAEQVQGFRSLLDHLLEHAGQQIAKQHESERGPAKRFDDLRNQHDDHQHDQRDDHHAIERAGQHVVSLQPLEQQRSGDEREQRQEQHGARFPGKEPSPAY